ncbi:methyl-CpG-binding domain-containing protein 4-like [Pistacia vera]|uniref:methyl-CpG-binding domain-containing protein 4-like n=1 Tax=Pistacia vera TaxID=55513 RepID=UPI001263BDE5|nr:methyl-CpG-binding domain-containing protein 4-like [Pistacia vera]
MEDKQETPKTTSKKSRTGAAAGAAKRSIDTYAAQCEKCLKWRVIDMAEEYEEIRSKITEKPFVCEQRPGVSCKDPADIEYDDTRVWVIDRPGLPKTPEGFQRSLLLRRDFSKMDAHYVTPTGKKLRTRNEVASFLEANPEYSDVPLSEFTFTVPKIMDDTIPEDVVRKGSATADGKKRGKTSKAVVSAGTAGD